MGMDLIALNPTTPDSGSYHVNWTGWSTLGDLLIELGCDTRSMAGSNDGDIVTADTARAWGNAIKDNLDSIVIERYPSARYWGGYQERFRVEGSATPMLISSSDQIQALIAQVAPRLHSLQPPDPSTNVDTPPEVLRLKDSPEAQEWLQSFADFCLHSGGFQQY